MRSVPVLRGPRPRKELGQHFLLDEEVANRIVEALDLRWEERVLEIGPGRGVLLRFLLKTCRNVTAVELDARLRQSLESVFGGHPGLELVFADFMRYDLHAWLRHSAGSAKIAGNIPYSLTSPILFRLFDATESWTNEMAFPLRSAVLMLQEEMARRLCARPGGREYGGITVFRALVADAELQFEVPASAFHPPPRVTSAVVRLDFFPQRRYRLADRARFGELVHRVFAQRRKMLKNTLGLLPWIRPDWQRADFDFTRRPEELSVEDFILLFDRISIA